MQISRLFSIIYYLLDKKETTAKVLAERLGVSIRTIYRDIDVLSGVGVPIYTNQGKGGGIVLLDDFVLNKSVLSEKEQDEILLGLQNLSAAQYPEINGILARLSSLFKKSDVNWIEVDFSPWGCDKRQEESFNLLKAAMMSNYIITFDYFNHAGTKSMRRAEPVKLIFKEKAWYLNAYCYERKAYRFFKVSRMRNLQVTEDVFVKRSQEGTLEQQNDSECQAYVDIRLRISETGAHRVYDDFSEEEVVKNEDGSFTVNTSLPEGEWLLNYLLSYGPIIEELAPQSLYEALLNRMEVMMQRLKQKNNS